MNFPSHKSVSFVLLPYGKSIDEAYIRHQLIRTMERICIYPKDIRAVTGKSERWGRNLIKKIREQLKKREDQLVTVEEFCRHTGLNVEEVKRLLR